MAMTAPLPIDVVSDVVCPWCYVGKRFLEKAIALKPEIPVEVRFRPYLPQSLGAARGHQPRGVPHHQVRLGRALQQQCPARRAEQAAAEGSELRRSTRSSASPTRSTATG